MRDTTIDEATRLLAVLLLGIGLALSNPSEAAAQVEIEADPIAYGLSGFSLHVAKVVGSARLNVGTFGADIPVRFHGNRGWDASMRGVGLKLDYVGSEIDGFFAGVEGGYMRMSYTLTAAAETAKRDNVGIGVRGGFRQPIGRAGLYVAPWLGVGYTFGDDAVIAGERFEGRGVTIFPTVHLGWRF